MRWVVGLVAFTSLFSVSARMGFGEQQGSEQRPTLRPTLHQGKGPSRTPNNSVTMNARDLMRVHTIYIEPMENRLNIKIAADLAKAGRFRLALDKRRADAILSGTCFDAPHLKLVHSEVFLNSRVTGAAIWQDEVRLPLDPPPLATALKRTAAKITHDLLGSVGAAENR